MYRKVDAEKNSHFIRTSDLPEHLLYLKEKWRNEEEQRDQQQKYQESLVNVKFTCNLFTCKLITFYFR